MAYKNLRKSRLSENVWRMTAEAPLVAKARETGQFAIILAAIRYGLA